MLSKCALNTDRLMAWTSLRKLVPGTDHLLGKVSPTAQPEPLLAHIWIIPTCPVTGFQGEQLSISLSVSPPEEGVVSNFHINSPNLFLVIPKHKATVKLEQIQRSEWNTVHWKITNRFLLVIWLNTGAQGFFGFLFCFLNPRSAGAQFKKWLSCCKEITQCDSATACILKAEASGS